MIRPTFLLALALALASPLLTAAAAPAETPGKAGARAEATAIPEPYSVVTRHAGRFNGADVRYTAIAGELHLKDDKDKPKASIFTVSYLREGVPDSSRRPVTFVFNGGPGSASLWLHMGVFGPKRVDLPSDARDDGAPPYRVVDNPLSLLDVSDLVFIDPVGTGYSRPLGEHEGKAFWGVKQDADSMAEFIRLWLTTHKRWNSPKYLAGESYGTTRAAALAERLQEGFNGIALNGVMLISTILDFSTARFQTGNELPYIGFLPTYAATHWYHNLRGRTDVTLTQHVERARRFALDVYAPALLKGDRLPAEEHARVRKELAELTGLSETYLDNTRLRIHALRFMKEFGRAGGFTVGRFDTRYKGQDFDNAGETFDDDPSGYAIPGGYAAALNSYYQSDLKVTLDREYKVLSGEPGRHWDWKTAERSFGYANVNVATGLGKAMRENADLRVLQASGYYDLATPFFAAENTLAGNGLVPDRVTYTYYEAGHMMYLHRPSLEALARDARAFILAGGK